MRLEPTNKYEFCQAFSQITGLPTGYFLKYTKGWEMRHFYEVVSWAKASKDQKLSILGHFAKYRKSIKPI